MFPVARGSEPTPRLGSVRGKGVEVHGPRPHPRPRKGEQASRPIRRGATSRRGRTGRQTACDTRGEPTMASGRVAELLRRVAASSTRAMFRRVPASRPGTRIQLSQVAVSRGAPSAQHARVAFRDARRDCGSLTVETMVAIPVVVLVLLLAVAAGRVTVALGAVEAAARDAARQASIARTPASARSAAGSSAENSLRGSGVPCVGANVQVDVSGFGRRVGTPATVSASVRCTVRLSDLGLPGLPGSVVQQARSTSPLDPYRGRE